MTKNLRINTSKIRGNKETICSLSLILLLAMTVIIAFAQPSSAQIGVPMPEKTTGYIDVSPHLVGVGQAATVNLFIYPIPTNYKYAPYFAGYFGITVTFVKPDGTKDTFMPTDGTGNYIAGETQSLGAIYFYYTPTMAGNWSVSFTMPAQNITDTTGTAPFGTVQMLGCTSSSAYFTVQTDPVLAGLLNGYPWSPLPNANSYWSNPINTNNREWNQISGDWLGSGSGTFTVNSATQLRWQPYGTGPNTAHIVWDTPYRQAGLVGGDYGSVAYGAQGSNLNFVIMQGKLYANIPVTTPFGQTFGEFECVDLATGNVLYTANGSIAAGFHVPGNDFTQSTSTNQVTLESSYGTTPTPYLYGTATVNGIQYWNYYDPFTGTLVRSLSNAQSARLIDGNELAYGTANGNLFRWNLTKVLTTGSMANNWTAGIEWQKPLPTSLMGTNPSIWAISSLSTVAHSDAATLVLRATNGYWGYSAATGASLWNLTLNYPVTSNEAFPLGRGVDDFIVFNPTDSTFECYSMLTGAHLWTSTSFNDAVWATTWTVYWSSTNDNENLYSMMPDGTVRAYSLTDGHEVWRSTAIASTEYPNNAVPTVDNVILVDGKLYVMAGYSSQYKINPISRFGMVLCINATNGDTIFTLNGGLRPSAAAAGYVIATGDYDGNLYAIGKGTTSTTVSAPQTTIAAGTSAIISGTVLDKSPASSGADLMAKYPNGVPAISDVDMSVWMDYLHMQNATMLNNPPQFTGVPVTLTAVDPNGNTVTIGTTTSDDKGNYGLQWTPTSPGVYHIYAAFAGSDSYFTSSASTYATVASVASPTAAPTSATQPEVSNSDMLMYLAIGVVAIIIAIAVVGVLILRKK